MSDAGADECMEFAVEVIYPQGSAHIDVMIVEVAVADTDVCRKSRQVTVFGHDRRPLRV